MSKLQGGHPDDGELLRYADGELSSREAKRIRAHLAACWECRTELDGLQRTIGECVRYRQTVLREHLPEPPSPWGDIYRRFNEFEESQQRPSWAARLAETMRASVLQPRRLSAAVAVALVVFLVVDQLRNTPSVRAAELLEQATVAAQAREDDAVRWIQLSSQEGTFTREIDDDTTSVQPQALAQLQPLFEEANYDWDNPLSAEAFARWRDGLPEKRDEVTRLRDDLVPDGSVYRIRTTTDSSILIEATLMLAVNNLEAVEGALRFRNYGLVEMTSIVDELIAPPVETEPVQQIAVVPPAPTPAEEPREVAELATPAEELQVFALLRQLGADLGEPVEVSRDSGQVIVSGVGVTPVIGQRIEEELAVLPDVRVRFTDPVPAPPPSEMTPSPAVVPRPEVEQLEANLERQLGGRAVYEQFVDDVLRTNDAVMARAHALRRLSERFPVEVESQLGDDDRHLLSRLRQEHALALLEQAVALEERSRPTLESLGAESPSSSAPNPIPNTWQAATEELLIEAREAESLIVAMLGGTAPEIPVSDLPSAVLTSVSRLRATAAEYARISVQ